MKLIDILTEIGDGSARALPWDKSNIDAIVDELLSYSRFGRHFIDVRGKASYQIYIGYMYHKTDDYSPTKPVYYMFTLGFTGNDSESTVLNLGEMYSIMATIMQMMDYLYTSMLNNNMRVSEFKVCPTKVPGETLTAPVDTQRGRLYMAYVEKYLRKMGVKFDISDYSGKCYDVKLHYS